ncbi:phenylalanine--tRNA ligase subunit beta [Candidatus Micrarchaeota archaeon]|nr:phenylalanine--tRNA ligase subunit beta [Candidatus Micrarchaeota archaeon]
MVVVEFSYKEMRSLVDIPREKMVESLSELGAPSEYEKETDKILAELTPNRPDWYSMEGLARALKAYLKKEHVQYNAVESDYRVVVDPSVEMVRPHTTCAVVRGLKFNDRRIRDVVLLQEKLLATLGRRVKKFGLGLYPLQAITFPVKYTTMKPEEIRYVPLGHEKEMSAPEIIKDHKKGQEYGHLIEGFERYPVFVDNKGRIMALIPVVNSAETGKVDLDTEDIFIEVTGTDINACRAALNILVCTFADMGGTVHKVTVERGKEQCAEPDLQDRQLKLELEKANRVLGTDLNESKAKDLLGRMGYRYHDGVVSIPPYRADIISFIDVVEDLAIAYGYNNFIPSTPGFFTPGKTIRRYDRIDSTMRGMGFLETTTFILTNKEKLARIGCKGGFVELENPSTREYTAVRPTILADILDVFATNKMKGLPQKFYEIGYVQDGSSRKKLAFGEMDKKIGFSEFRGVLQSLAKECGFEFELEKKPHPALDRDLSCVVMADGKEVGVFGKIGKELAEQLGIGFDVYVCEMEAI